MARRTTSTSRPQARSDRFVALLRGIAPTNPNMRNEKLRGVVEDLGFTNVETVISSGNILFDVQGRAARDPAALEERLEAAWQERLGFRSTTILRSGAQVAALVEADPFAGRPDTPSNRLQVTFLQHEPPEDLAVPSTPEAAGFSIVAVVDRAVCSTIDLSGSRTPDLMRWMERTFGQDITTRTWKTVQRIAGRLGA